MTPTSAKPAPARPDSTRVVSASPPPLKAASPTANGRLVWLGVGLPNIISFARLLSAPFCIWLLVIEAYGAAFVLFLLAGLTDALDGYLAKRLDLRSEFGAYLDAVADKLLLASVFVTLGWQGHLPLWIVILVIFRDFIIVGGCMLIHLVGGKLVIRPTLSGKATAAAQVALAVAGLAQLWLGIDDRIVIDLLVWTVAAATVLSGAHYLVVGLRLVYGASDGATGAGP
ncbi:MAG: CDP-alcohol phosphatidyltransferase family protein [Alphaproteobacteria bacterium]|nr:CDP-alcohol phosphatidyltransferase family protein [Alphaproteobacteria bacterium]